MSKTLFTLSRLLLTVHGSDTTKPPRNAQALVQAYDKIYAKSGVSLSEDYTFADIARQCQPILPRIWADLETIVHQTPHADKLGLLFNSLVRGKWDSGEGLGTFLTPEEVTEAIVAMVLTRNQATLSTRSRLGYVGDICGGTGRFPFSFMRALHRQGLSPAAFSRRLISFDQSTLATDYARLNFHFLGLSGLCHVVEDSLVAPEVTALRDRCVALATNPPFGANKYQVSQTLYDELSPAVLRWLVRTGTPPTADPSALFVFRNLDLLQPGGVLGIVLPDGVLRSTSLTTALRAYEDDRGFAVEIRAIVSLPPVTFAFGGTVAKTSFVIMSKETAPSENPLFVGTARHVGFLKRRNRRVADPKGNDLPRLVQEYMTADRDKPQWVAGWRDWKQLGISRTRGPLPSHTHGRLRDFARAVRERQSVRNGSANEMHVSVLDVDETGLVNVLAAQENRPASQVLACRTGDILISCINPRIWRVAAIPNLPADWTCSAEFLVVRPNAGVCCWELAMRLHQGSFKRAVQIMAGGTSSSRQRVNKDAVLDLPVPELVVPARDVESHKIRRERFYRSRLDEGELYRRLHGGNSDEVEVRSGDSNHRS